MSSKPKPVPASDQMRVSGTGRRKVALPPGRSQLDWVRNSAGLPYIRARTISFKELRRHRTRDDAWMAIHGNVYNVTHYLEYHPGGIDMILSGAGKDGTRLFNKYHAWVNPDFMLKRCYLGTLDMSGAINDISDDESESEEDKEEACDVLPAPEPPPSSRGLSSGSDLQNAVSNDVNEDFDALHVAELEE